MFLVVLVTSCIPTRVFGGGFADPPSKLTLVKDGKPEATIVVAKEATELERNPANELQEYVQRITGAVLPVVDDARTPSGNLILVGKSHLTRQMGIDLSKLPRDAFTIKTAPGRLVLAGHDAKLGDSNHCLAVKRGTANAVNAFLQDYCGVRWFMPGELGEVVPHKTTLEVPAIDRQEELFRLFARGSFSRTKKWAGRNFFGTGMFISNTCHLWRELIPAAKYFKDHPEWFALVGGKRIVGDKSHVYLCTSNRQMWAEALKNFKGIYARGYEAVVLCQADGYRRCRCEKCEAMDGYRIDGWYFPGTPADRVWLFHDFLARGIKEAYPDRKIIILAYGPTGEVPHRVKSLPANVIVEWCHPTPPAVKRWTEFHDQFSAFIYWFTSETRNYLPVSMFYVAADFKRLASAGANGFCFCGGADCWGTNAPTYYLIGRLLRDPATDPEDVLDEFCRGLFQQAASPMKDFFTTYHRGAGRIWKMTPPEETGKPYGRRGKGSAKEFYLTSFTDDVLSSCRAHLEQAERLAPNQTVRRRVDFFKDGFLYSDLTAQGFARYAQYKENPSEETLAALKEAVGRRNRFVEQMYQRQKGNGEDLPPVLAGSLEDLLYGSTEYHRLAMPFKMGFHHEK